MSEQQVEMPGGPSLTHYHGRGVEGVEGGDGEWTIILSGDVRITNHEEEGAEPDNLGGLSLLTTIFSELDTRMIFGFSGPNANPAGNVEVRMNPTGYSITDPAVAGGEHYPQRAPEPEEEPQAEEMPEEEPESDSEGTTEVDASDTGESHENA